MINVDNEIYKIEIDDNEMLVYAPLHRKVYLVRADVEEDKLKKLYKTILDHEIYAKAYEVLNNMKPMKSFPTLRLNITEKCTLRCLYCAVNENNEKREMDLNKAKEIINYYFLLAKERAVQNISIRFSGGEPTFNMEKLKHCVELIRANEHKHNINCNIGILTNGAFKSTNCEFLANNFNNIQVSFDGLDQKIIQRPFPNGEDSSMFVFKNIEKLYNLNPLTKVRITVGRGNIDSLENSVKALWNNVGNIHIDLGLIVCTGNCKNNSEIQEKSMSKFANIYLKLWKEANYFGRKLTLAGTEIEALGLNSCGLSVPSLVISPNLMISGCTRIINELNENSSRAFYGNFITSKPKFNREKVKELQKERFDLSEECKTCFAKWHCNGGCPLERNIKTNKQPDEYCEIIREIVKFKLLELVKQC